MTYETPPALPVSGHSFAALFDALPGSCILLQNNAPHYTVLAATPDYLAQTGYEKETIIGKGVFEMSPANPGDPTDTGASDLQNSLEQVRLHKVPHQLPLQRYDIAGADGSFSERYWSASNKPVFAPDGKVAYIIHCAEDITEMVKSENREADLQQAYNNIEQREAALKQFKFMADNAQDAFILMREDGTFAYLNPKALEAWGYTAAEAEYIRVPDADPIYNDAAFRELFGKAQTQTIPQFETLHQRKDGKVFPVEIKVNGIILDGQPYLFAVARNITERKRIEAAVLESESRFRSMIEQAPVAITLTRGPDVVIESINASMLQIMGRQDKDDVLGKKMVEVLPELKGQQVLAMAQSVWRDGIAFRGTEVPVELMIGGSAQTRYFNISYTPIAIANETAAVLHVAVDVTEQVVARRKVEESEAKLRSIINSAPTAICVFAGPDLIVENPNQLMIEVLEAGPDIEGQSFRRVLPDLVAEGQAFLNLIETVRTGGQPFEAKEVAVYFNASQTTRYFNVNFIPLFDESKAVYAVLDVSVDVTEQVLTRKKIEESEGRFRLLADASPILIWMLKPDGSYGYVNKTTLDFLNVPQEQIASVGWAPFQHPDDVAPATAGVQEAVSQHKPYKMEHRLRHHNGTYRWVLSQAIPAYDANGNVFAYVGSSIDIHEAKINREKLQRALEQVQLSKEAAELGTFDMDLETGTMHWDERCRAFFGISHHNEVTFEKDFAEGLHPDDRERILKVIEQLFIKSVSNGDYDVEYRTVGADDGVVRWIRAKGKVYFNSEEKPIRFIGSVLDITEKATAIQKIENLVKERTNELAQANDSLLRANQELQRSNANLEEFAHAASHDLKEPIRKIHFFTQRLKDQLSSHLAEGEVRSFGRIEHATQRMGNLIDDLLLYSHVSQRPHETEAIDLNENVQRVLEDLELDIDEKKAVIHVGKLPTVMGYRRQLQQLLQNLLSNALKYSKANEPPRIHITASVASDNGHSYDVISVKDNGIGFDQQYAEKIFQMFSRLHGKAEYSGTGVGLSIVKKVVQNHDGFIRVESAVDEGSRFDVYLPA